MQWVGARNTYTIYWFFLIISVFQFSIFYMQVFLDEVNTSSCLGLFKEIIIDHTFDGEVCEHNTTKVHRRQTGIA